MSRRADESALAFAAVDVPGQNSRNIILALAECRR